MKKIIVVIICLIIGIMVKNKNDEIIIPDNAIRIRIIANSNNIEDLYQKKIIKNLLKKEIYQYISRAKSNEEARKIIEENIENIKSMIALKTSEFELSYGKNYFPKKIYKGVIYNAGEYESLVITLGSGLGDNWWCVLYPPLCLIEDNETIDNIEYKLAIKKVLLN